MDWRLKNISVHDRLGKQVFLIKIGLIMEKKIMKKNMFGRKGNCVQEV